MDIPQIKSIFSHYQAITADFEVTQLTSGHINHTYLVCNNDKRFILQKVNTNVFKNLDRITHNMITVSAHLENKAYPHQIMKPLSFKNGNFLIDEQWRLIPYFEGTQNFEKVQSTDQAYEAAKFLSEFHSYLSDLKSEKIHDSIPGFTDFGMRYNQFESSLQSASNERLTDAQYEIEWVKARHSILEQWNALVPELPNRIIHADPKISNFLFEQHSPLQIRALIDWDTLMSGSILFDFGDMVRSYTNLKAEDDPNSENNFSAAHFTALKKGFLHHLGNELTQAEIDHLDLAAKVVIYVQTVRFLTDYLNNDTYYAVSRPAQNLDRTKNQLNLSKSLDAFLDSE